MAASAYAFLVSLTNTMDQIHLHPFTSACFDNLVQFESLSKKVNFLLDFVENYSHEIISGEGDLVVDADDSSESEDLLGRIAVVAQKAEDLIEVEAAHRIRDGSTELSSSFLLDLHQKIQEMDGIINEDVMIKVKQGISLLPPTSSTAPPPSSAPPARAKTTSSMVGFDGYLIKLLDELSGYHSGRRVLPIVGMGGVGKTTLAANVYENPLMMENFDVRVWVTVSQTFSVNNIFQQALSCIEKSTDDDDDDELGQKLYKSLYGRRYLIILDDMWSTEAWEKIMFYFPDNNNRSRIVVTTREQQLVDYFCSSSSSSSVVVVDLLDKKNSWKLFCDKTFAKEGGCPRELEEIGKNIVKKCRGLPLAIELIGGILGRSPRTHGYWEKIAQEKSLVFEYSGGGESNKPLSMLYLSYKHLPVCFKPCFLYLGLFPEDHRIDVSKLTRLWIAEGFIKPKANQTLEEVAESYVKELVDRNLLLVGGLRLNKKFKTCFLHDLVRELCIRIAEKEKFYCVQRDLAGKRHFIVDQRSASSYPTEPQTTSEPPPSLCRPRLFKGRITVPFKSRLLRVLVCPRELTSKEVNLRLLDDYNYNASSRSLYRPRLPSSISLFWSLQTLLFHKTLSRVLVSEIWKMPQLRHIESSPLRLPDPPPTGGNGGAIVLRNLQTLKEVWNLNLSEEVCMRIPNIKELEIHYISQAQDCEFQLFNLQNVGCLNKLESLSCSLKITLPLKNLKLPNSLKELSLKGSLLPWSYMAVIGLLPNLQILHLLDKSVVGGEWILDVDEIFLSLKYLQIRKCDDLFCWDADTSNFPVLETLSLECLNKLEEIPSGIGDIPTLELMEVYICGESAIMSAIEILEEQQSLGNLDLRLQLRFQRSSQAELWKGKFHQLGITCQNLHISSRY